MSWHRLLERQIRRYLGDVADKQPVKAFLNVINDVYKQTDRDRVLLERSLEVTSEELHQRNLELRQQLNHLEKAQHENEQNNSLLTATLNATYDGLLVIDHSGLIRLYNPILCSQFVITPPVKGFRTLAQVLNLLRKQVLNLDEWTQRIDHLRHHPTEKGFCELKLQHSRLIEAFSVPLKKGDDIIGQVWSFRDVSELKLREAEAEHRAHHDMLTGLPNRMLFMDRLRSALFRSENRGSQCIILFIDLDGFKDVNDSLGHSAGDILLVQAAKRLQSNIRETDTVGRQGGDEFVLLIENPDIRHSAARIAENILRSFEAPFNIANEEVFMTTSIGIALSPQDGTEAEQLLGNADLAMYQAKDKGKNNHQFYSSEMEKSSLHRLQMRNRIKHALEHKDFFLVFQPKVDMESKMIMGAEALIRWIDADGNYINPMDFIPIAEDNGQIIPISQWVIRKACEHLRAWKEFIPKDFNLAINISARHFVRGVLTQDISNALETYDIDPSMLELEVTETAIMDNLTLAVDTLQQLKRLGISSAIDDFGTGYSSLNYLRKLPIEILKIDKSFVDDILTSHEDRTLVKGIIDMVHALKIKVVAEGVENKEMGAVLKEMNCDYVQGYFYCKPVAEETFIEMLKSNKPIEP